MAETTKRQQSGNRKPGRPKGSTSKKTGTSSKSPWARSSDSSICSPLRIPMESAWAKRASDRRRAIPRSPQRFCQILQDLEVLRAAETQRQQTSGQTGQCSAQRGIDIIEYRQHTTEQHHNDHQHDQHQYRRIQQCRPNPAIHLLPGIVVSGQGLKCFLRPPGTLSDFYQSAHVSWETRSFPHRSCQGPSLIRIARHILQHWL